MYKKYQLDKKNEKGNTDVLRFANILTVYAKTKFHQINHPAAFTCNKVSSIYGISLYQRFLHVLVFYCCKLYYSQ